MVVLRKDPAVALADGAVIEARHVVWQRLAPRARNVDLDGGGHGTRRRDPERAIDDAVGAVSADQLSACHPSGRGVHREVPVVLDSRHSCAVHEGEVATREVLLDEAVVEFRPADGVKHDARMSEAVRALAPEIELDGVEGSAHGRIERVPQRARRLERDAAGAGFHPGKARRIDLHDTESSVERHRRCIRAAGTRADDDEVEVVHTWEIVNGRRMTTRAGASTPNSQLPISQTGSLRTTG